MKKNVRHGLLTGFAVLLTAVLVLAGCTDPNNDKKSGEEPVTLPESAGANALSGKTYFTYQEKIAFAATGEGARTGTYTVYEVKMGENWQPVVGPDNVYEYIDIETGSYSWNADAKTVTTAPEKVRERNNDEYGELQTKAQYRAALQAMVDEFLAQPGGQEYVNQQLASMGFSSVAAYIDYSVAQAFRTVTCKYDFSADGKALFLDEKLPANKGANELSGKTFARQSEGSSNTYAYTFTADTCTLTTTYDGGGSNTTIYAYAYDSTQRLVYLITKTDSRQSDYTAQSSNTATSGNFATVDDYNAAYVNQNYDRLLGEYVYNLSPSPTLVWR
jgi:hypothetical protein